VRQTLLLRSDLRDQGFVRPKILILVPFRNTALEVVKLILQLAPKLQQVRLVPDSSANAFVFFSVFCCPLTRSISLVLHRRV
jgi:hypothetical protein